MGNKSTKNQRTTKKSVPLDLSVTLIASRVIKAYSKHFKINSLWPWQVECLNKEEIARGGNLLISTPTSSGKSLVGEVWMLNKLYL